MENIEAMLCAYIEGDLDEAGRAEIEKHLKANPQHQKLIEELIATRNLVRGLPRVNAPHDVGDGIEGQVERSFLLDDGESAATVRGGGVMRWSQFLAIAAVFLLFLSLALILISTVGPTLKPVSQLQTAQIPSPNVDKTPAEISSQVSLDQQKIGGGEAAAPAVPATQPVSDKLAMDAQSSSKAVAPAPVDLVALKQKLESSGYSAPLSDNAGSDGPVILVINSTDPAATEARVAEFLNNQTSVSWQDLTHSQPSTQPSQLHEEVASGTSAPVAGEISTPGLSGGSATGGGGGVGGGAGRRGGRGGGGLGGAGGGGRGAGAAASVDAANSPGTQPVLADKEPSSPAAPTTEKDDRTSSPDNTFAQVPQMTNAATNAISPPRQRAAKSLVRPGSAESPERINTLYIAHGMNRQLAGDLQRALSKEGDVRNTQVVDLPEASSATQPATQSNALSDAASTQAGAENRDLANASSRATESQMQAAAPPPVVSQTAPPAPPPVAMHSEINSATDTVIVIQFAGVSMPTEAPAAGAPASQP